MAVEELIRLSCLRFSKLQENSFLAKPRYAEFYRGAMAWIVEREFGGVGVLRVHGQTIAVATAIHLPGQRRAYYHIVGRDPDAISNHYAPGIALAAHVIHWAIERGATEINLGQGFFPYKTMMGGVEYPQCEFHIARSANAARILRQVDRLIMAPHNSDWRTFIRRAAGLHG